LSGSSLSAYISAAYGNGIKRGYFIAGNFAEQLAANYYHDVWYYAHADNYALVFMEQQSVGGVWYNELNTQTGSYNFSAWKQLVTTDNPSFFGASTFDGVATFKNNHDWTSAVFGGKDGTDIVALGNVSGGAAIQGVDSGVATPKNLAINPFGGGVYANNSKVITEASIPAYYPRARASATYSDSIAAGGSLFKTIPFNAGAEPKKLLLYFLSNSRGARVAALKDSTGNYLFHMGGIVYENGGGFMGGEWVRDFVSDNDLLRGGLGDLALGSGGALALKNVTFNASGVTLEFHDYGEATTLMTSIIVEVY
jgi:hypothetical protein